MFKDIFDRISYHAVYDDSILDALEYGLKNGFKDIQVGIETPHLSFENFTAKDIKSIVEFQEKYKMYLTLHAPDDITSLFAFNLSLQEGIINYYISLIDFAKAVKARLITIHMGNMAQFPTDEEFEMRIPKQDIVMYEKALKNNIEKIHTILPLGLVMAIENYKMDKFIQQILEPYLKKGMVFLCWDLAKSNESIDSYFQNNLQYVKQVHLHDLREVNGKLRGHRVIGSGIIAFRKYFGILQRNNVLDYCIEVRPKEKALESLIELQKMLR